MYTTNRNEQLVNVSYNSLDNFEEISSHDETKLKLLESDFSLTNSKAWGRKTFWQFGISKFYQYSIIRNTF